MSDLKVKLKPSEEVVQAALAEMVVTDRLGRKITIKKPGILAQYRLVEVLEDSAKNEVYMGMVLPIIYVSDIDGEPVYTPTSKREVEALVQQLDEAGFQAVMEGIKSLGITGQASDDKDKDKLKKP